MVFNPQIYNICPRLQTISWGFYCTTGKLSAKQPASTTQQRRRYKRQTSTSHPITTDLKIVAV